jgi:hypothetical protein
MDTKQFTQWLDTLKEAWEERNPSLIATILDKNIEYYEIPGQKPYMSVQKVVELWQDVPQSQKNIHFDYTIISVNENVGIAHWIADFERIKTGAQAHLDGIFLVWLNEKGLCTRFQQWWYEKV